MSTSVASAEGDDVKSVIGCITDISHLKWAEKLQTITAEAAKEAKRQQERFIDMTSHEMRNPLSAMLQCADGIALAVERSIQAGANTELSEDLDSILENAQTITFCAAHQKRIIDDILTVSKLDSSMLVVTPVHVQPWNVLQQTMQMFETELAASGIISSYNRTESYHDLKIDWVYLDPSRLTQILINLLTNAVKFTKTEAKREIHVTMSASVHRPTQADSGIQWFPSGRAITGSPVLAERDTSQHVYLFFTVRDTGKGVTADEMSHLFRRFSQANPKTHIQVWLFRTTHIKRC